MRPAAGSKADTDVARTELAARQYQLRTQLAELDQRQETARLRGDLAQVAAIEQQKSNLMRAAAETTEAERIQAETRVRAAQAQTARQGIALAQEAYSAQQKADQDLLKGAQARGAAAVASGRQTPRQALLGEGATLIESTSAREKDLAALMKMADATGSLTEKTRIYWPQWDEGIKAETQAEDILKRMAADAKKTADAFAAPFKQAFDGIGSSLETALNDRLFKRGTTVDIRRKLDQGVTGSLFSGAEGFASKGAASLLGAQGGKGLGDFFGDKALSLLGLGGGGATQAVAMMANTTALGLLTTAVGANTAALAVSAGASTAGGAASAAGGIGSIFSTIGSVAGLIAAPFTGGTSLALGGAASAVGSVAGNIAGGKYSAAASCRRRPPAG